MVERIKNKKGFTIIEVMVVIALIGILAAVLVPKFSGVKDTAKTAGMLTNAKTVEAYVASVIDSYTVETGKDVELKSDIDTQFGTGNELVNPYTGATAGSLVVSVSDAVAGAYYPGSSTAADDAGIIYVVIDSDTLDTYINGFNSKGVEIEATKRTIER